MDIIAIVGLKSYHDHSVELVNQGNLSRVCLVYSTGVVSSTEVFSSILLKYLFIVDSIEAIDSLHVL